MSEQIVATPAVAVGDSAPKPQKSTAPTIWEQIGGVFTEPVALFQRLGDKPRWGQAFWAIIFVAWFVMVAWALHADVEAMQRPILEQNARLSASQIEQTIAVSQRFILPMGIVSVMLRNLFGILGLALVFWLFAATTEESKKTTFLHAVSAATIPNMVLLPYMLMMGIMCMVKPIGGQIPERLAPSGLAYYLQPQNPKLYGILAQVDPFWIAYYVMLYLALRNTMRMKTREAVLCAVLATLLTLGWKVYFWV